MYHLTTFAALALAAVSTVSAFPVPRATAPSGYAAGYLEPYDTYHARYTALGCQSQHSSSFFNSCCHPLLATESLSSRPAQCNPDAAAQPSSTVNTPADTDSDDDEEDCDDEDDEATTSAPPVVASTHAATTTQAAIVKSPATTKAATTKAAAPAAQTPAASPASSNVETGGFATFFTQNGVAGACGTVHQDTDFIAAIDADRYGDTGRRSSLCGKQVKITNTKNNKSVTVTIADACPTCNNGNSIDLSKSAFESIATVDEGIVPITWNFV